MRGGGGSEGGSRPWLSMAAASSSQTSLQPLPLVQQTKLTHVKVEVGEGMSWQPDGGAGAEPLLLALHRLHRHRHPRPHLPPGLRTHILLVVEYGLEPTLVAFR